MGEIKSITRTEITEIMMDTKADKPTNKIVSSTAPGTNNSRFKSNKWGKRTPSSNISTFQGENVDLNGQVFVKGLLQTANMMKPMRQFSHIWDPIMTTDYIRTLNIRTRVKD